jgi:two-component system, cell cycle response regulator CtrA
MIQDGGLIVNLDVGVVSVNDQPVHLTGKEYAILELLSRHKGTTVTKEMLLNHLYAGMNEPEIKIIDVFICKLRKKLAQVTGGNHHIETVWGRGYVLHDPRATAAAPLTADAANHDSDRPSGPRSAFARYRHRFCPRLGDCVRYDN